MALNKEYEKVADALHAALLTAPATKADCATYMIGTYGVALSQAAVERSIDLIVEDLFNELVLPTADYAALLARHQTADPTKALRVLNASAAVLMLEREKELNQAVIAGATAEWTALSPAQKAAIPNIKAAGDAGVDALNGRNVWIDDLLDRIEAQRQVS